MHADLKELVDQIRALELSRDPIPIPASSFAQNEQAKPGKQSSYGMSPKKTHEVLRMSAFVSSLLPPSTPSNGDAAGRSRPQVVDIGAGQVRVLSIGATGRELTLRFANRVISLVQ